MMLDDMPETPGISFFEGLEDPTEISNFGDYFTNPTDMVSLTGGGLNTVAKGFLNFAKARGTDLLVGAAMAPMFGAINDATQGPWASRGIQLTMSTLGFLLGGDPFGLIAAPIGWMIQEFIQDRASELSNDDPEKMFGKKWGYVREGGKWYPAVAVSEERDRGDSDMSTLRLMYGKEVKWGKEKGTKKFVPDFDHKKFRTFRVHQNEMYGKEAENAYRAAADPLRDFYLMSDDDASKMLNGFSGGDVGRDSKDNANYEFTEENRKSFEDAQASAYKSFQVQDDPSWEDTWKLKADGGIAKNEEYSNYFSQYSGYVNNLQDIRSALDFIGDYRFSAAGDVGSEAPQHETDVSRKLRRVINEGSKLGLPEWGTDLHFYTPLPNENTSRPMNNELADTYGGSMQNYGLSRSNTEVGWGKDYVSNFDRRGESDVLLETFSKELRNLYDVQGAAAKASGFYEKYQAPAQDVVADSDMPDMFHVSMDAPGVWKQFYLDRSWDMPEIKTEADLRAELRDIEEASDDQYQGTEHYRNRTQQDYLAQKAIVRFWKDKINDMGGGRRLFEAYTNVLYPGGVDPDAGTNINYNSAAYPPWYTTSDWDAGGVFGLDYGVPGDPGSENIVNPIADKGGPTQNYHGYENTAMDYWDQTYDGFKEAGMFSGTDDPDFIAGNYKPEQFEEFWEQTGKDNTDPSRMPTYYDPETKQMVPQVWNQTTQKWEDGTEEEQRKRAMEDYDPDWKPDEAPDPTDDEPGVAVGADWEPPQAQYASTAPPPGLALTLDHSNIYKDMGGGYYQDRGEYGDLQFFGPDHKPIKGIGGAPEGTYAAYQATIAAQQAKADIWAGRKKPFEKTPGPGRGPTIGRTKQELQDEYAARQKADAAEKAAARKKAGEDAAAAAAAAALAAAAAAEARKKTVPDTTPGATHPHDDVTHEDYGDVEQHHDYHATLDISSTVAPQHLGSLSSMFG
jgi:hypothetical protein